MTDEELEALRKRKLAEMEQQLQAPETPDALVTIHGQAEFDEVIQTHDVVIVDFHAEWCGPCKQQTPILESVAADTKAVIATVDIDQHQGLAQSHGVKSVPTLILYAEGEPSTRLVGVQSAPALNQHIERLTA